MGRHCYWACLVRTPSEREEYEKEIEKLRQERVSLETEVESYRQKNQGYEDELRSLGQTLQGIDQRQRQLVDSLAHLLQSPGYGSGLMDQSESPSKKRRLLALRYLRDEAKVIKEDPSHSSPLPVLDLKYLEKLDSSLTFWETFLHGIDQIPPENEPSSPMEPDINVPPCTPPQECCNESLAYDPESRPNKPSGVDMKISPDARSAEGSGTNQAVAANDVFWQQFLTEAPAPSVVQAEQREAYERTTNPSRFADEHKPWWTVDGLTTQHTGHLSQAERI
ncbi:heat stress transcription factor A-4a-like [Salvia splendens]|uniref:heat stress transcription factor A-4a-like n=1 Tax=Salvia splendens TaxID=180675 RepID=UPI001C25C383|nr:heat stress transcription factor A-4a-like [Salvia splendens]